jgi:hypothetical protein
MDLKEVSQEVKEILDQRRKAVGLSFVESKHIYYMMTNEGKITSKFPSVSKIIKNFYKPFDAQGISARMAKGDLEVQRQLLAEWKQAGEDSVNLGSRAHFELERYIVEQYDNFKEVRRPKFYCDENQIIRSDKMIESGKKFIDLMHKRGAVLIDTEMVMGDPTLGYVGQSDDTWLMLNREQTDFGFVVTDYKSNQPKNFEIMPYTEKLYPPFDDYPDNALGHYYLQIPLYGKLLMKMLEGSKYENNKFLGGVVVLLKDDGTYVEYKVPQPIVTTMMSLNLKQFI